MTTRAEGMDGMNKHRTFAVGAIFAILLTLIGGAGQASAATQAASSNVSGNTYTSPDYGYSISWDSTWQVSDEQASAGYNMVALDNGTSTVYLEGVDSSGTTDDCVASVVDSLEKGDGVSNVAIYKDESGEVSGSSATRSYAVYSFDYAGKNGSVSYNEYIDCRPIEAGKSMLAITDLVLADKFLGEVDPLVKLLGNLSITGGGVTSGNSTDTGNSSASTGNEGDLTAFIKSTEGDIDSFWKREFPIIVSGADYKDPDKLVTFDAPIDTGCGAIKASDVGSIGPFYCPSDNVVYYDLKFADFHLQQFKDNRSVISVALAHEIGHHVQNLAGWKECTSTPCMDPQEMTSQEIELQADCFAGAWTADAEGRGRLGSFDVETNIAQFALLLGDQSGTEHTADAQAHGNGALRTYWFLGGYYKGATECLTVSAATDPARNGASIETTPAAGNSGDLNDPSKTTPTATSSNGGAVAIGDKFGVALSNGDAQASITATDVQSSVAAGVDAKGQYLIVYFNIYTGAKAGATFDFTTFTVTDSDGTTYQADVDASDAYLKTSPDLPDGVSTAMDANTTYQLAVVFDVPASASGFTLATADGATTVTLDR
jgi:predicted metalloprotease